MKVIFTFLIILLISGCASRKYPAPIVKIEQVDSPYVESHKNTLTDTQYVVEKGETLYSIAWRAGIDFRHLAQLNQIKKPYEIYPGQVISLVERVENGKVKQAEKQSVTEINTSKKNNQKTIAKENSEEYGKKTASQKLKKAVKKELDTEIQKDSFPSKVRHWRYPSDGKIIDSYSTKENGNKGIDFGGKPGDPIIAAADGKVVYAGSALRGFGNLIIVKHNNDYLSAYAHNRVLKVKEQDWVKAGQVIAEMGDSGTDKVKLHFEIRFRGRTVNPLKYLPKR